MGCEKDAEMLIELNETLSEVKQSVPSDKSSVYCKEEPRNFSTASMSFEDITAAIMEQTEDLFAVTRTCDRFSPEYLKLCKTLVKSVNHLGSCFLTKTALIQKKYDESKLDFLSAERLYEMISCNFRKTEAALNEKKQTKKEFDLCLYNQMLTFAQVMVRLRSTQRRAFDINHWYEDPWNYEKYAISFTEHDSNRRFTDEQCKNAPFRESPSYELRRDILQEADARRMLTDGSAQSALPEPVSGFSKSADEDASVIEGTFTEDASAFDSETSISSTAEDRITEGKSSESSLPAGVGGGLPSDRTDLITELPSYKEVLENAMKRSNSEDGSFSLTIDEICTMLCDDNFRREKPQMAKEFFEILDRYDYGTYEDPDDTG